MKSSVYCDLMKSQIKVWPRHKVRVRIWGSHVTRGVTEWVVTTTFISYSKTGSQFWYINQSDDCQKIQKCYKYVFQNTFSISLHSTLLGKLEKSGENFLCWRLRRVKTVTARLGPVTRPPRAVWPPGAGSLTTGGPSLSEQFWIKVWMSLGVFTERKIASGVALSVENRSKNDRKLLNDIDHENCPKFYRVMWVRV